MTVLDRVFRHRAVLLCVSSSIAHVVSLANSLIVLYNIIKLIYYKEEFSWEDFLHSATAGTDESGDVVVTVTPADQTQIILYTALRAQFGEAMKQTVGELLDAQQLTALVELHDRGALDWIIRARLETALARAQEADR